MQTNRIGDIPKIRETLRQIEGMATFKAALPLLKPFMRLLGIDSTGIEASLQTPPGAFPRSFFSVTAHTPLSRSTSRSFGQTSKN